MPTAVVMNLFYTGLGIARSLGEHGVPVIGLTAQRGIYGNFSRYARTVLCADSRNDPDTLLTQLRDLGQELGRKSVLFPTRDHDLVFLDRFRSELEPYFLPVLPSSAALDRCLNKWDTYRVAVQTGVPTPKSWLIQHEEDLLRAAARDVVSVRAEAPRRASLANRWQLGTGRRPQGDRRGLARAAAG